METLRLHPTFWLKFEMGTVTPWFGIRGTERIADLIAHPRFPISPQ